MELQLCPLVGGSYAPPTRVRQVLAGLVAPFTWRYWFAPGCRLSYRVTRYVFALLYLYLACRWVGFPTQFVDLDGWHAAANPALYRPLGILSLFGNEPPSPDFYKVGFLLLRVCPIGLLLGFFSRLSLLGCVWGLFTLSVYEYGYAREWSHGFSPLLVPSLFFLLGPAHADGFDGWLRRRRGRAWHGADDRRARAVVLSVQLLVSLIFLDAACFKIYAWGEGTRSALPWVFSDGMRNIILRQHVLFDVPVEEPFHFIVTHAFAYRGMAMGNMIAQTLPFLALWFMNRPWLRLLCGIALAMEVIGLGVVMGIWNPHWLLFIAFFIDWDRLVGCAPIREGEAREGEAREGEAREGEAREGEAPAEPEPTAASRLGGSLALPARRSLALPAVATAGTFAERRHLALFLFLLGFNCFVMAEHGWQHPWTFPFTSYPMFSHVVADRPYNQHLPTYFKVSRFEVDTEIPPTAEQLRNNWLINWGMMWIPDTTEVNRQIATNFQNCTASKLRTYTAYRALLKVEPYPSCDMREVVKLPVYQVQGGHERAVAGIVLHDGDRNADYIEFKTLGFGSPEVRFKYFTEDGAGPFDLPGTLEGDRYYFKRPEAAKVIAAFEIIEVDGTAVLFGGPIL